MSDEEKRQIRAAALLEAQEAREDLAFLEAKMFHWNRLHRKLSDLSGCAQDSESMKRVASAARRAIIEQRAAITEAADIDALLALDVEISNARERLESALSNKRMLGL